MRARFLPLPGFRRCAFSSFEGRSKGRGRAVIAVRNRPVGVPLPCAREWETRLPSDPIGVTLGGMAVNARYRGSLLIWLVILTWTAPFSTLGNLSPVTVELMAPLSDEDFDGSRLRFEAAVAGTVPAEARVTWHCDHRTRPSM